MKVMKSNLLLLLVAAIWGLAFVAQRVGMDYLGPFYFNGIRFLLGSLSLMPLLFFLKNDSPTVESKWNNILVPGLIAGTVLFCGASFQQIGLVYTTAGKAAFITGLYVVLVPVLGLFLHHKTGVETWTGCLLAITGIYFLCVKESSALMYGDLLELIGAFFWAVHILIIGYYSTRVDVLKLSAIQFLTCALLSFLVALMTETFAIQDIRAAAAPLLYGGICSVGIAYTLQALGQRYAPATHTAIILSMETVFAAIGGLLLLQEILQPIEIWGCLLMLSGMIISQVQFPRWKKTIT
ncbi:Drug/metabolite transporter [Syntrophomonas zehnderi OL-4]|uniref:Drug/metabolite transporter n=1 Tax=Syntrophomonas zehnderi OL-4 TaxID=690567 RepID=A0A0E4GAB3_9FIRM|nr:DMT family transporter [Syntrophomonas zehnderi]CFX40681.1 Drug/metabolite transporter [Syntrophomonas zehnderi OL-4]